MALSAACSSDSPAEVALETIEPITPPPTATVQPSPTPWPTATPSPTSTTPPTPTITPDLTATWTVENAIILDQDFSFQGVSFQFSDKLINEVLPALMPPRVDGFRTLDNTLPNFEGVPNHIVIEGKTSLPTSRPPLIVIQSIVDETGFFYPDYEAEAQEYFNELRRISITRPRLDFFYQNDDDIIGAQYIDFANGKGISSIRYLPSKDEPEEITNQQLFFTYEGITEKGNFYVWVQIPVETGFLPDQPTFSANQLNVLAEDADNFSIYTLKEIEKIRRS
ncbi:MAG: hypothetical protein AAGD96_26705, partial [Chloroflexota bacterium]